MRWIALDIDGTLTCKLDSIPEPVSNYLESLSKDGWNIMILTGRAFSYFSHVKYAFKFPYYLALQNGADILKMPEKKLVKRTYLTIEDLKTVETIYEGEEDLIVYSGFEQGDFCYFRPEKFSSHLLDHIEHLKTLSAKPWQQVKAFDFHADFSFPLIKCFGAKESMRKIEERLNLTSNIQAAMIADPIGKIIHFNLVTHSSATKGNALRSIIGSNRTKLIAAGDDRNDLSMFKEADVRIVMETAPKEVLAHADIIAPPASACGIIEALEKAIKL